MDEDQYRDLTATLGAHRSLIRTLLMWSFEEFSPGQASALGEAIKQRARDTTAFNHSTVGDEFASERLADIVILMQQKIDAIVDEAVETFLRVSANRKA